MLNKINFFSVILGIIMICFMINVVSANENVLYHKYTMDDLFTYDYSGNNNNATIHNVSSKLGILNGCAVFNGSYSYLTVVDNDTLSFTDNINDKPFSISFWVNHEFLKSQPILEKGDFYASSAEYTIGIPIDVFKMAFWLNDAIGGYLECITDKYLYEFKSYSGWLFIFCTYDGLGSTSGLKIYVNGNLTLTTNTQHAGYSCMKNGIDMLYIGSQRYLIERVFSTGLLDELKFYDYEVNEKGVKYKYDEYINTGYYITLLPKNNLNIQHNISVFRENEFVKTIQYGETISFNNTYDYTFLIHEDITDEMAHIENINNIAENNISYIVYIIIIFMILGLIIYLTKK